MEKAPEEKLKLLRDKIQKDIAEANILEGIVKEKDCKLKQKLGIKISKIETILNRYRKKYINFKGDIDRAESYGGPDPDGGRSIAIIKSKMDLLKDIILTFEEEIYETLKNIKKI
jgi:hypothetical protein